MPLDAEPPRNFPQRSNLYAFRQRGPEWLHPSTWRIIGVANRFLVMGPRSERLLWRIEDLVLEWKNGPPRRQR